MQMINTIGIALVKNTFQLHGVDDNVGFNNPPAHSLGSKGRRENFLRSLSLSRWLETEQNAPGGFQQSCAQCRSPLYHALRC